MSPTTKALLLHPELLEQIYEIMRGTDLLEPQKKEVFAILVAKHKLSIRHLTDEIRIRNRTGWKEVVGKITKLTGYGFVELGLSENDAVRLKNFGNPETMPCVSTAWEELLKKSTEPNRSAMSS